VKALLDAGALIALDEKNRELMVALRLFQQEDIDVWTSAGALAQAWRPGTRQANLARMLPGFGVAAIDREAAKKVGELLGVSRSGDLVDAHVCLLVGQGDKVYTSDDVDIEAILSARRVKASVVHV
jgi:hypothetical protein